MAKIFAIIWVLSVWPLLLLAQAVDTILVEAYAVGSFQQATRIVAGRQGKTFVLDADENKVIMYTNLQDPPKTIGGFGWSSSSFDKPSGITTDGVNIYVADYGNHRIQRFDRDLNYISSFSTRDTSDVASRFGYPLDVALSELGDLFILDGENIRVMKFSAQNFYERAFGDINAGRGKLQNPVKLFATDARIFVGDKNRIVLFDYFGNYMGSIGEGVIKDLCGFTVLPHGILAAASDKIWWFTKEGALEKSALSDNIISEDHVRQIQDVASNGNQVLILTPHKIHVFNMGK
jgi:DNA-binding beta-propeller fold protein YncE